MKQVYKNHRLASGKILGVAYRTCTDGTRYYIQFEMTNRAATLIYAIGKPSTCVSSDEDAGKSWYQIDCDDAVLDLLRESVDGIGNIIFNLPTFGQMLLIDETIAHE
jgi:hypothetical protein